MSQATLHFHAELNDFLPRARRDAFFTHSFPDRASIKDLIESLGPPHTEVAAILVNGAPVDFSYLVRDGDRIEVYPVGAPVTAVPLRPSLCGKPRFVLDTHLGQLTAYLRMLGFDTLYRNDYPDDELARISIDEQRILLTRDRGLLKRSVVTYGYFVRATSPRDQVVEVLRRYDLATSTAPLRRCIRCNGLLRPVDKAVIDERLAPRTRQYYDEFSACDACDQIYWKGSHYQRMQELIADVLGHSTTGEP